MCNTYPIIYYLNKFIFLINELIDKYNKLKVEYNELKIKYDNIVRDNNDLNKWLVNYIKWVL